MRGRACREVGIRGAKAGSQERESSLGSLYCRGEGTEEGEREAGPGLSEASGAGVGGSWGASRKLFSSYLISQVMHNCGGRVGECRISIKGG